MSSTTLADTSAFRTIPGLWKGKAGPLIAGSVIRSTNFRKDGLLDYSDVAELEVEERAAAARQLEANDIIIERSGGGPKQPVGRVGLFVPVDATKRYFTSNFTTVLRIVDRARFDPLFVSLFMQALYSSGATETLQRATTGIRNLDWNEYLSFEIPELPLVEQRFIANGIAKARRAYLFEEELIELSAELKRTTMRELFTRGLNSSIQKETEFGPVPASWQIAQLDEYAKVQTGAAKGRKFGSDETVDVPYLRVANVQDGHLDLREMKAIRIRKSEVERYRLHDGDVVLTEGGDFDKLGRGFIWRDELDLCVHQNHVFAVRTDRAHVLPEFFAYLAQSSYGKAYFLKVAHKTTNLACINSAKLKAFPLLIPPNLDEQREIIGILSAVDSKIDLHRRKKTVLEALFRALLHKLMIGEIRVADLDLSPFEPAKEVAA